MKNNNISYCFGNTYQGEIFLKFNKEFKESNQSLIVNLTKWYPSKKIHVARASIKGIKEDKGYTYDDLFAMSIEDFKKLYKKYPIIKLIHFLIKHEAVYCDDLLDDTIEKTEQSIEKMKKEVDQRWDSRNTDHAFITQPYNPARERQNKSDVVTFKKMQEIEKKQERLEKLKTKTFY